MFSFFGRLKLLPTVLELCLETGLEAQMFIKIPCIKFSTEPAFLQNPC